MRGLWRRRPVRHLVVGLLPLVAVAVALIALLSVRFDREAAPVRQATGEATATVTRAGLGAGGDEVELRWSDSTGQQHVSLVRVPGSGQVKTGTTVTLRYNPSDPGQVYVGGDTTYIRLRNIGYDIFLTVVVLLVVAVLSAVHVVRRVLAERRPGQTMPVTYARSRPRGRGLVHRSWLVLSDGDREWWVPVHWDPVLATMLAKTPATVHGRPLTDRVLVVDVNGTPVWQAGRKRPAAPSGALLSAAAPWSKSAQRRVDEAAAEAPPGLAGQFRNDVVLLVAAPILGLFWSYFDGTGAAGFAGSTVLFAAVLLWLPSIYGSDPT
jgi:hypothetical protein